MRRRLLLTAGPVVLVTVIVAAALASSGGSGSSRAGAATSTEPAFEELPTRNSRAKAVEPVAGETAASAALPTEEPAAQSAPARPAAQLPRIAKRRGTGPTDDAAISKAEVLKGGIALPPLEAPQPVHDIIEAGNSIARTPYLWGGGHGRWLDKGYDCSGSISYALAAGGLLSGPLDSGRLMHWGKPGPGKWVTIYTNPSHVYMVVAGVRFDTSGRRVTGSRWQSSMRAGGSFVARHPPGL